jgi:hypothetical protein
MAEPAPGPRTLNIEVSRTGSQTLGFVRRPVQEVATWLAKYAGTRFIIDDRVAGRPITIVTGTPVTPDVAMQAFFRALALAGVGATTRDGFVELAPQPGPAKVSSTASKRYELRPGQFNLARHLRGAKFIPAVRDGKTIGMKILALAPGSRLHTLGFARGDTILRIAGWPVTSPADALAVYGHVRQAKVVDVDILRGDREMRISCPLV